MVSERTLHNDHAVSDDLLLDRVRHSDQQAMADVFDRYGGMVYSVALRVLNDQGQAEDVMQEVFFQLWKKPDAFVEGRGSLGGWLMVLARNRAIDQVRRRKPTDSTDDVVLPANSNLASESERNLLMEKVRGILKGMPMEQQRSLELAYFEGLSHTEIAERTGDPLGTVKTRIRLALIGLRKALAV
jgi:RNA polymerase sigma-70 factor (ECF subfamily)